MLQVIRTTARSSVLRRNAFVPAFSRSFADKRIENATQAAGEAKNTSPKNPSVLSSAGAVGKQFNPDGALGSIPQSVGGPFDKDGAVGRQFDAAKDGIAGQVEKAVDGPSRPATEKKMPKL